MTDTVQFLPLIGWPLLPVPNENGELHFPSLEASVRQSIQVILQTRPGEQLMHPQFGAGLEDYLNAPNTLTTHRQIRDVITDSLTRWERRIHLDRVEVATVPNKPTQVRVEIAYRLRRTGVPQQVRLTLQLEST
jgi:phage baseplate assembly protein W